MDLVLVWCIGTLYLLRLCAIGFTPLYCIVWFIVLGYVWLYCVGVVVWVLSWCLLCVVW